MGCKASTIKKGIEKAEPIIEKVIDIMEPRPTSPAQSVAQEYMIQPKRDVTSKLETIKGNIEDKVLDYLDRQIQKIPVNQSFDMSTLKNQLKEKDEKLTTLLKQQEENNEKLKILEQSTVKKVSDN